MLKKTALFCAIVGGFTSGAFANDVAMGTLDTLIDGYSQTRDGITAGLFSDRYTFSLSQMSDLFGSIDTSFAKKASLITTDITSPTLDLYYSGDASFGGDVKLGSATIGTAGSFEFGTFDYVGAAASGSGFYYFMVAGTAGGSKGGKYDFSAAAAPVPEPTAAAMLLAGFAVMGFIAMRRRRQD